MTGRFCQQTIRSQRGALITDAQVHIWNANTPEDPWGPGAESHLPDAMPAERLMWASDQTQTMGKKRGT